MRWPFARNAPAPPPLPPAYYVTIEHVRPPGEPGCIYWQVTPPGPDFWMSEDGHADDEAQAGALAEAWIRGDRARRAANAIARSVPPIAYRVPLSAPERSDHE